MSEQERNAPSAPAAENSPSPGLHLEEWIREDIVSHAGSPESAAKLRALPTRQLLYYCTARRLAATLEHVMKHSLHYSRKFVENPGREAVDRIIGELKKTARLCLGQLSAKSYGLIEINIENSLSLLPFTWPEELEKEPEAFLSVSQSEVDGLISQSSSGTGGGAGKRIFCTRHDLDSATSFFSHGMRYLVSPGSDRVALLLSAGGRGGGNLGDVFGEAMRRLGVACLMPQNPLDECATLRELAEFKPTCVIASPRQAISLFRSSADSQCPELDELVAAAKSRLKKLLLSGDKINSAVSQIIAQWLGVEIFIHYGMVESGLGLAVECGCRNGCHYRESEFFIEIISEDGVSYPNPKPSREAVYIDPDDLEGGHIYGPTPWGEVTITTLGREGSPLIRYRTGDSGRIIVDKCACGSVIWRIEARGRIGDYIALPNRPGAAPAPQITHSVFDRALYALPWLKDYQVIVQSGADGKPKALGLNALLSAAAPPEAEAYAALGAALAQITARMASSGGALFIRALRDRQEFLSTFKYSHKRSFTRSPEPFDPALYRRL